MTDKLPHNLEAEKKVLGAMARDVEALAKGLDILEYKDFYQPSHAIIFSVLQKMFQENKHVDLLTLSDALEKRGDLNKVGGSLFLAELVQAVATTTSIEHHAKLVQEASTRRQLIAIFHDGLKKINDLSIEPSIIMEQATQDFLKTKVTRSGLVHVCTDREGFIDYIQERNISMKEDIDSIEGLPTGFDELDKMISGLNTGLYILAARPSIGKSALALNIANAVSETGKSVLFYSYEMTRMKLLERLVSSRINIDLKKLLSTEKATSIFNEIRKVGDTNMWVNESYPRLFKMVNEVKRFSLENEIGLLVVDYIGLVPDEDLKGERYQRIGQITRELKNLATSLNIPVLALSQLNRSKEKESNRKPRLSDLRESGNIEQDADVVLALHRETDEQGQIRYFPDENQNNVELMVLKNRDGGLGIIELYFNAPCFLFKSQVDEWNRQTDEVVEEWF